MLKLIQLGLTFTNAEGKLPLCGGELCVWQFNFRFAHSLSFVRCAASDKNKHCLIAWQRLSLLGGLSWCREFKLADDMFAQDSIELLKQSGIDFAKMEARGIDVSNFGELLMSSGIVLNEDVRTQAGWLRLLNWLYASMSLVLL